MPKKEVKKKIKFSFDERYEWLIEFKEEFGHVNVPCTDSPDNEHYFLGEWCQRIRRARKDLEMGKYKTCHILKEKDMKRLDKIGFDWNPCNHKTFEERFNDLMAYKKIHGHTNVPKIAAKKDDEHFSLGLWVYKVKLAYKNLQTGRRPLPCKLTPPQIDRLKKIGFDFTLENSPIPFDDRVKALMEFKAKYGHLNVPNATRERRDNEFYSLMLWCDKIRHSFRAMKEGNIPRYKLTPEQIQCLDDEGFEWSPRRSNAIFDARFSELMDFKRQFGHPHVPKNHHNRPLVQWCDEIREAYQQLLEGMPPVCKLTKVNIKRLDKISFIWDKNADFPANGQERQEANEHDQSGKSSRQRKTVSKRTRNDQSAGQVKQEEALPDMDSKQAASKRSRDDQNLNFHELAGAQLNNMDPYSQLQDYPTSNIIDGGALWVVDPSISRIQYSMDQSLYTNQTMENMGLGMNQSGAGWDHHNIRMQNIQMLLDQKAMCNSVYLTSLGQEDDDPRVKTHPAYPNLPFPYY